MKPDLLKQLTEVHDAFCLAPPSTPSATLAELRKECTRLDKECREAGILPPPR